MPQGPFQEALVNFFFFFLLDTESERRRLRSRRDSRTEQCLSRVKCWTAEHSLLLKLIDLWH